MKNCVPNGPCHFLRTRFFTVFQPRTSLYEIHKAHRKKNMQKHEKTCFWRKNQAKNDKNGHFWWKNRVRQKSSLRLVGVFDFRKGTSESQLEICKKHVFWRKCTKKHTFTPFFSAHMPWSSHRTLKKASKHVFFTIFDVFLTIFHTFWHFFQKFEKSFRAETVMKKWSSKKHEKHEKTRKMTFLCFLCTFVFFITNIGLPNVKNGVKSCFMCHERHFIVFYRTRTCLGVHDR